MLKSNRRLLSKKSSNKEAFIQMADNKLDSKTEFFSMKNV